MWRSVKALKRCRDYFCEPSGRQPVTLPALASILVEAPVDQIFDLFHRLVGVRAFAANQQLRTLPGGQHHETHDTLAVDLFAFLLHPDFGAIAARDADEHGRRPRVQTEAIDNRNLLLDFLPARRRRSP